MKKIGGNRRKTRYKMRKSVSERGKLHLTRFLQNFEEGERVLLKAYPSYQRGIFCLRFHGKTATVKGMQGECYKIELKDGNKLKECVVHPVHLLKA
jgi:large subunit ribosomal protein L21e